MAHDGGDERQYHPAYPASDEQPMVYRTTEDGAAYPDMVYQAQAQEERNREEQEDMPDPAYPDACYMPPAAANRKTGFFWPLLALVCLSLLAAMGIYIMNLYRPYAPFRQKVSLSSQGVFAQGVMVDQVNIGGMTQAQAEAALQGEVMRQDNTLCLYITVDGLTWAITADDLPLKRNTQEVLNSAYAVGRQGIRETIGSSITPFEYRWAHLYQTAASPVSLRTSAVYDPEKVRQLLGIIESRVTRTPVNAQIATFDQLTRSFTFSPEQYGATLDMEQLYNRVIDALDRKDYSARIEMDTVPVAPQITQAELTRSFTWLSTYTTFTTDDPNRNKNIDLAARAINRMLVMPGETFSFNAATGERTAEKGYQPAAAIAGGAVIDEVGGGVCQVSSTLFNACAMANLTIVSRSPHTWPSTYVDKGRDATVNWPDLDFRFRNDTGLPVFIIADYQANLCTVEIYGASLGDGMHIDLETAVVSVQDPPTEPNYEYNPQLPPGTVREKKKARTGYEVETYKVFKQDGREIRRELLCTSRYEMIRQVLEYNNESYGG